jgi:C7-cyclitol 7-kinase
MVSLVFDVGGTRTRAGLFDSQNSKLIASAAISTPNHLILPDSSFDELCNQLLEQMFRLAADLCGRQSIGAICVGFAGPVDDCGNILAAPTLWSTRLSRPYPLAKSIASRWPGAPVTIVNDVTAAGYRYLRSVEEDFCIVTVSSGIGNKVFVNGRPLLGSGRRGGELGHLVVDSSPDAPPCECGGRGHLGAVASGRAALEIARMLAPGHSRMNLTSPDLAAAFRRAEPWAIAAIERAAAPLGWALAAVHASIGMERFVLIGGFALALGEAYRELVARAAAARCWGESRDWQSRVELGWDDDMSGLIGAGIFGSLKERSTS